MPLLFEGDRGASPVDGRNVGCVCSETALGFAHAWAVLLLVGSVPRKTKAWGGAGVGLESRDYADGEPLTLLYHTKRRDARCAGEY